MATEFIIERDISEISKGDMTEESKSEVYTYRENTLC